MNALLYIVLKIWWCKVVMFTPIRGAKVNVSFLVNKAKLNNSWTMQSSKEGAIHNFVDHICGYWSWSWSWEQVLKFFAINTVRHCPPHTIYIYVQLQVQLWAPSSTQMTNMVWHDFVAQNICFQSVSYHVSHWSWISCPKVEVYVFGVPSRRPPLSASMET